MARQIDNSDDVIDSRDVIARLEELESEREDLEQAKRDANEALNSEPDASKHEPLVETLDVATLACETWDDENGDERKALKALANEAEGSPDWAHGETLIRDSYFEDYARELAEDIGAINKDATWPNNCIDWEEAAELLQQDYFSVDFDGVTYWIRS